jgi:hypothetical protein
MKTQRWTCSRLAWSHDMSFGHVEQLDSILFSGWTRISVQLSGLDKSCCSNSRNLYVTSSVSSGSGCPNPRVELTNLFNSRVVFELLFEILLYDQAIQNDFSDVKCSWNTSKKKCSEPAEGFLTLTSPQGWVSSMSNNPIRFNSRVEQEFLSNFRVWTKVFVQIREICMWRARFLRVRAVQSEGWADEFA